MKIPLQKFGSLHIIQRFYLFTVFLIITPMLILSATNYYDFLRERELTRERELYGVADHLNRLLPDTFNEILEQWGALEKPAAEQVKILNQVLQPIVNDISMTHPGLGLGFYSSELDKIIAIGPEFEPSMLKALPHDAPYFLAYKTGKPELTYIDTSVGWQGKPILHLAYPIYRNGKIIGHSWASIKLEDVYKEASNVRTKIIITGLIVLFAVILATQLVFNRFRKDLKGFANAITHDSSHLPEGTISELKPLLDLIKKRNEELKDYNEVLKRERQRLYKLLDSLPAFVYLQAADYSIRFHNHYFIELFGAAAEKPCYQVLHGVHQPCETCPTFQVFRTSEPEKWEVALINGRTYQIYNFPFTDIDGTDLVLVLGLDINELRMIQREIGRLDRLNLIGEMAGSIAHEVRNPMATVRGFLQFLSEKQDYAKHIEYFKLMIEELDRANSIISEFLSLARGKNIELTNNNLRTIVNNLFPLLQADALKRDKEILLYLSNVPDLLLDEKEIRQLIINLVRNGLEAVPPGGRVKIKTYTEVDEVVLAVQDNGCGISPDILEKLGQPFVTTKDTGTGLGLSVCYSIAGRHNARIDLATSSGGTTFYVRFKK